MNKPHRTKTWFNLLKGQLLLATWRFQMRATRLFALTVLVSATFATGAAMAGEALYLTPPLFREQARETQQLRSVSDLNTTPQPVAAAEPVVQSRSVQVVAEATAR